MTHSVDFSVVTGRVIHTLVHEHRAECAAIVRAAYEAHHQGRSVNPKSYFLSFPAHPRRRIIALPAHLDAPFHVSGIKWIASYPENIHAGLPRASAAILLNRTDTGYPFACLEGSIISAARTAASAELAAHTLVGERRVQSLSIVGTGLIARYVYEFFTQLGWQIARVYLHDLDVAQAQRFRAQVCDPALHPGGIEPCDLQTAVTGSELVVFSTVAPTPYVTDVRWLAHAPIVLNLSLRDLAPELVLQSNNVVDDIDHVLSANTSVHLAELATGRRDFIHGTLAELLEGGCRLDPGRATVFSPFGLGVLDLALGRFVYDRARAQGMLCTVPDFFFDLTR